MINNLPLISIGIPAVKSAFLHETIQSALDQTYKNVEIIIVNNAVNNEKKLIKNLVKTFLDNRIQYFENSIQLPIIQNWNFVLSKTNGMYFSLLSDDDYWDKDFLKELFALTIPNEKINIFHSRVAFVNEKSELKQLAPLCSNYEDIFDFIYHRVVNYRQHFVSDFMLKNASLKAMGGFVEIPDAWGSDDITWFKLANNEGVGYCDKPLFFYRESTLNITNSASIKNKLAAIPVYINYIKEIVEAKKVKNHFEQIKKEMIVNSMYQLETNLIAILYKKKLLGLNIPLFITNSLLVFYFGYRKLVTSIKFSKNNSN